MPNKRKSHPPTKGVSNQLSEDPLDDPDPQSRSYVFDEIDEYHATDDKILLDSNVVNRSKGKKSYQSVLPLLDDDDDSSDQEEDFDDGEEFYASMAQKDEIASDLEEEENMEDGVPSSMAWGKKKGVYYDTDYVDKDYGGYHGSDEEMAEEEEKEAMAIQKRLLQQLDEEDFAIQWTKPQESETKVEEKVALDLSKMSKNEKLQLLKRESPEFLELVEDFKLQMSEVENRLQPLLSKISSLSSNLADYVLLKHQLIMIYCTNISFYLIVKCRGEIPVHHHPVLKRLATYKKLLEQLETVDQKMSPSLNAALSGDKLWEDDKKEVQEQKDGDEQITNVRKPKRKLKILEDLERKDTKIKPEKSSKKTKINLETADEKEALEMYGMMKEGLKKQHLVHQDENPDDDEDDQELNRDFEEQDETIDGEGAQEEYQDIEDEKRGITYQMAKNKGLMPHRKKEYRNPRVKHRMKFRKANIRRKGQVKESRKELQRYGGETSGIRIGVKHGIKLK